MTYRPKACISCSQVFEPRSAKHYTCDPCVTRACVACGTFFSVAGNPKGRYCSSACYLRHRWRGHRVVATCAQCGKQREVMASAKKTHCSITCAQRANGANPDTQAKKSKSLKGNPLLKTPKRIAQLNAARAKYGGNHSQATIDKIRARRMKQTFPLQMTSIERALFEEFKRRRLRFEMHLTMFGRWQPDFVFDAARLIVQADGDYWHSLPRSIANDARFNETAAAAGWTVFRFSETTIKASPAKCARAVAKFVRDQRGRS